MASTGHHPHPQVSGVWSMAVTEYRYHFVVHFYHFID